MASTSEDAVTNTLNILVNVTEKRDNLRNNLQNYILKAVNSLRTEFANLRSEAED
jgi:hypothetical protein